MNYERINAEIVYKDVCTRIGFLETELPIQDFKKEKPTKEFYSIGSAEGYIDEEWYGFLSPVRMGAVVIRVGCFLVLWDRLVPIECIARTGESNWQLYRFIGDSEEDDST